MIVVAASALAVVFAVALLGKLSREGFGEHRRGVGGLWPGRARLSPAVRHALAVAVLAGEALAVIALATGIAVVAGSADRVGWLLPGFLGATTLLSAFTVGHAVALRRGATVSCACFGRSTTVIGPMSLLRNILLSATGVTGLLAVAFGAGGVSGSAALPAVLAGSVLGLLFVNLEELVDLFRPSAVSTPGGR